MFTPRCPRCQSRRIQHGFNDAPLGLRLLGINELFCHNCHLEFKGFALPGSLKRVPSSRDEAGVNRRRAPRFKARLTAYVSLMDVDPASKGMRYSAELRGQTRQISAMGLSVELPESPDWSRRFNGSGRRLRIRLLLPAVGPIHLHIAPVYQAKLDESRSEAGHLIAGPITKIEGTDRARLLDYLGTLQ